MSNNVRLMFLCSKFKILTLAFIIHVCLIWNLTESNKTPNNSANSLGEKYQQLFRQDSMDLPGYFGWHCEI